MSQMKPGEMVLAVIIGLAVVVVGVPGMVLAAAQRVSCGQFHVFGPGQIMGSLSSGLGQVDAGGACAASTSVNRTAAVVVLLLVAVVIGVVVYAVRRWKQSGLKLILDVRKRDGIAQAHEVKTQAGTKALKAKAGEIRPTIKRPKLADAGRPLGASQGQSVWVSMEDSVVLLGPPRSGKGFFAVINSILDSPGAVVTTSTRGDNVAATKKLREKTGPVTVFDPQGLSGYRSSLKWSPFHGCEDPTVARNRAGTLIAASGMGQSTSNAEWAEQAEVILMYLLQAAALGKCSVGEFAAWGQSADRARDAVEVLEQTKEATPGWAGNLRAAIETDPKMQASKWMGVAGATQGLTIPGVAEALDPKDGDAVFDAKEFIESKGTLYLLGTKSGGGASAPFLIALMDEISVTAREMAFMRPKNRLEPPLSFILDEIANIAPWKELPTIMSDGGGVGISTMVVLQSPAQARAQWGADNAEALLNAAIVTVQLGGSTNDAELRKFTDLMGERKVTQKSKSWSDQGSTSSEQSGKEQVMTVAELRRLPKGYGLLLNRAARPIILKMRPWIRRRDAKDIKASMKEFGMTVAKHKQEAEGEVSGPEQTRSQSELGTAG